MSETKRTLARLAEGTTVEAPPGIHRTAMAYDKDIMICHFSMKKGAAIPLHNHDAAQNGYLISGKVKFLKEDGSFFIATPGTGYAFPSREKHGAEVMEDSEVIEAFAPMRPEYSEEAAKAAARKV